MRKLLYFGLIAGCFSGNCMNMSTDDASTDEGQEICAGGAADSADADKNTGFFGKIRKKAELSLIKAVGGNKKFRANAMLAFSPSLSGSKDEQNNTALMEAVNEENIYLVEKLLDKGADVNVKNGLGDTALLIACQVNNLNLAKKLLERNAEVNAVNDQGESPLMLAVQYGNIDLTEELLNKGADADIRDASGRTPLMEAASNDNVPMMRILMDRDADADAVDEEGKTAYDLAGIRAKAALVRFKKEAVKFKQIEEKIAGLSRREKQAVLLAQIEEESEAEEEAEAETE